MLRLLMLRRSGGSSRWNSPDRRRPAVVVKMDIEGEGEITVAELRLALLSSSVAEVRSLASADNDLQKLFDAVDFDHSGKIHWNEFLAATINLAAQDEQQLRKAFDRLDCDNSGEISLENLKAMVGKDIEEADLAEMLREVDIKKNGASLFAKHSNDIFFASFLPRARVWCVQVQYKLKEKTDSTVETRERLEN